MEVIYFEYYFGVRFLCNQRFNKYMDMRLYFLFRFIKYREIFYYGEREFGIRRRFFLQRLKRQMVRCCVQGKGFYNQRIRIYFLIWYLSLVFMYRVNLYVIKRFYYFNFLWIFKFNFINFVSFRVDLFQEIKIFILMVFNFIVQMYVYGYRDS